MTPPPLWNFSENSSVLEGEGVPKGEGQPLRSADEFRDLVSVAFTHLSSHFNWQ